MSQWKLKTCLVGVLSWALSAAQKVAVEALAQKSFGLNSWAENYDWCRVEENPKVQKNQKKIGNFC